MKVGDLAVKATEERSPTLAARFSDWCRNHPTILFTFAESFEFLNLCRTKRGLKPVSLAEWDELLRAADDGYDKV